MGPVDVLIHVNDSLDDGLKQSLEAELRNLNGVLAPRFNTPHLLMVAYDPAKTSASKLLNTVRARGYQGQLIGL